MPAALSTMFGLKLDASLPALSSTSNHPVFVGYDDDMLISSVDSFALASLVIGPALRGINAVANEKYFSKRKSCGPKVLIETLLT